MNRPAIVIVDDEAGTLTSLHEAVERRYGRDYRISAHGSPRQALAELERMRSAGDEVALVVADQWMPELDGVEFLQEAHKLHPGAQRGLLVTWGDSRAAPAILNACLFGKIENYILRPWYPPEVHLFPMIGNFLSEWTRKHGPRLELVRVIGSDPSPRSHEVRVFLERSGIPHGFYTGESADGARLLKQIGLDASRLPVVIGLNGRVLINPSNTELADELGTSDSRETACDLLVIGAGPAGLAAGVYAASEGLKTLIVEREAVGGQAGTSSLIRNYLGFPAGISGNELALRAYQQAWLFGAKYALAREATALTAFGAERIVPLSDGAEISAKAVLIATGAAYRRLDIPDLERYVGTGVFYAAGSEALGMKGNDVVVAGGGNSAGQAVVHLAASARKVTLLVRKTSLAAGMSDYLVQNITRLPNVDVRLQQEAVGGGGGERLEYVTIRDNVTGREEEIPADAFFVLIGAVPHTDWLGKMIARDAHGFVVTGGDLASVGTFPAKHRAPLRFESSMPGVFAAGDVRSGSVKRVASAVGEGAVTLHYIHEYLKSPMALRAGAAGRKDGDRRSAMVRPATRA